MGLVRKHFLIVSTLIVTTIVILLGILAYTMPIYYNQSKLVDLQKDYTSIVKKLDGQPKEAILRNIKIYDDDYPNILLILISESGQEVYPNLSDEEIIQQSKYYLKKDDFDQIGHWSSLITSAEGDRYAVEGEYGFHSLSGVNSVLATSYPFVFLAILALSSVVAYVYSRLSNQRITAISQTTRQMQFLEEGVTCQVGGQDEIATLAQDINRLYTRLLTSIKDLKSENEKTAARERQQADFLRVTAHELKTPISSMLGLVEGMIYNVGDFKNHDTYLNKCRDILQDQSQLVQSILEATNLDLTLLSHQEQLDLKELIEQHLATYYALAELHAYDFQVTLSPVTVTANATYLLKAIKNIVDNAFRYTKEGGRIRVVLMENYLRVDNQAEHLPEQEELDRFFLPFYRPDFSRAKKDGGTGIGLYMVKQILDKQGFAYQMESQEDFVSFTIYFNTQ
ncbi:sensor histidine kinase [Streptococcus porci]|uniref:sensor histidine kinase n=1 Tax=Streptococcus porci TaxID=502567 RepID=UPI000413C202|nr:HAMP domain-containing sensor histidine kinase [Streptococcus porci]